MNILLSARLKLQVELIDRQLGEGKGLPPAKGDEEDVSLKVPCPAYKFILVKQFVGMAAFHEQIANRSGIGFFDDLARLPFEGLLKAPDYPGEEFFIPFLCRLGLQEDWA